MRRFVFTTALAVGLSAVVLGIAQSPTNVVVPLYGAGYAPAADPVPPAPGVGGGDLSRMAADIAAIRKLLEDAAAGAGPAQGAAPDALKSGAGKCAACHESAVAATKGGAFTIFDSATKTVAKTVQARDRQRIVGRVKNRTMPPPGSEALTDAEMAALVDWFSPK